MAVSKSAFEGYLDELVAVLDVVPTPMAIALDAQCAEVRLNRAFSDMVGVDYGSHILAAPMPGRRPANYAVRAGGRELLPHEMPLETAVRTGEEVRDREIEIVRIRDGARFVLLATAVPLRESEGCVRGAIVVYYDISERRRMEEDHDHIRAALAISEQRYRMLTEALPQFVWILDAGGNIQYVNRFWSEFTGLSLEQSRRGGWTPALHPDDVARSASIWQDALARGERFEAQLRFWRADDGVYRWMLLRTNPVIDSASGDVRWVGTGTDIDDHKRAEASLRFLTDAGNVLASSLDVNVTLTHLAELAVGEIADWCAVYLRMRDGTIRPVAITHRDPQRLASTKELYLEYPVRDEEPIAHTIRTGESLLFATITDSALRLNAVDDRQYHLFRKLGMRSAMVVPLRAREGNLGAIWLVAAEGGRVFSQSDMRVANLLAKRAAIAVENAYLYEEEQRSTQRLRFLAEASKALSGSLDLQTTLDTLVRTVVSALADWSIINLIDASGAIRTAAIDHADPAKLETAQRLRGVEYADYRAEHGTGRVIRTGQPEIVPDLPDKYVETAVNSDVIKIVHMLGHRSAIVVPLKTRRGTIGSLTAVWSDTARSFGLDDLPLFEDLARRAAVAIENAQLYEREHHVASTLQQAFLPATLPQVAGLQFSVVYAPGATESEIGGDWYDAFALPDGRVIVSIGDVAGRGLTAALTMGKIRQAIRAFALMRLDPALILNAADEALRLENPEAMATALIGLVDPVAQTLTLASAGHPHPMLRHPDGTISDIPCDGLPLGLRRYDEPDSHVVDLPVGSFLVLYTDGLTEATRDVEQGEELVRQAMQSTSVLGAARDAAAYIMKYVLREGNRDDVAILTLAITPLHDRPLKLELPALPASARTVRQALKTICAGLRVHSDIEFALQVSVGEAVMNAIEHAYGVKRGVFRVNASASAQAIVVEVEDDGIWRAPRNEGRGRGLHIMRELCQNVEVLSNGGRSLVRLTVARESR